AGVGACGGRQGNTPALATTEADRAPPAMFAASALLDGVRRVSRPAAHDQAAHATKTPAAPGTPSGHAASASTSPAAPAISGMSAIPGARREGPRPADSRHTPDA